MAKTTKQPDRRRPKKACSAKSGRHAQLGTPPRCENATAAGPRPATLTPDKQDACVVANSPRLGSAPVGLATEGASFSDGAFSATAANSDIGPDHRGDDYGESDEFTWNKDLDAEAVGAFVGGSLFKDPESAAGAEASRASVDDEQAEEVLLSEREQKG
ncbi:hypothetical protein JCM3774_004504 [Rhodotorula dairenensis]